MFPKNWYNFILKWSLRLLDSTIFSCGFMWSDKSISPLFLQVLRIVNRLSLLHCRLLTKTCCSVYDRSWTSDLACDLLTGCAQSENFWQKLDKWFDLCPSHRPCAIENFWQKQDKRFNLCYSHKPCAEWKLLSEAGQVIWPVLFSQAVRCLKNFWQKLDKRFNLWHSHRPCAYWKLLTEAGQVI